MFLTCLHVNSRCAHTHRAAYSHLSALITHSCSLFLSILAKCFRVTCTLLVVLWSPPHSLHPYQPAVTFLSAAPTALISPLPTSTSPSSSLNFPFDMLCVFISIFLSHCHSSVSPLLLSPPSFSFYFLHTYAHSGSTLPLPHSPAITWTRIGSVTGRSAVRFEL